MILAPTLTLNALRGPSVDPDAAAFAAASGATDVAALSAFVKGVKDLGLWNNMVCWPLRSSQNAGTGTTAYSLGGLGTFNGTLVNGPTWGVDGVNLTAASNHYISANWVGITTEITAMAVHALSVYPSANRVIQFRGSGINRGGLWSPFSDGVAYWDAINESTARTSGTLEASANTFFSHIGRGSAAGLQQWRNGTTSISSSATPAAFDFTPTALEFGRNATAATTTGTISFVLLAQNSSVNAQSLHNLYKQTLGQGLSLP